MSLLEQPSQLHHDSVEDSWRENCAQNPHDGLFSRPSFLSSYLLRSDRRDLMRTDLRKADLFFSIQLDKNKVKFSCLN